MSEEEKPRKGKHLGDFQMGRQGQQPSIDPEEIATHVWSNLVERFSTDKNIDDYDLAKKYLRNRRRASLFGLMAAKIGHQLAVADMVLVGGRRGDDKEVMEEKARQVDIALRHVEAYQAELKAVTDLASSGEIGKIIDDTYGTTGLAKDNEGQGQA